jgi:8-oxo-dGTP diphosphatase
MNRFPRLGAESESTVTTPFPEAREIAAAIVFDTSGHLLLQLRDNISNILYPGKISLFGGHREGDETFLECVIREIHEELGYYLPPEQFKLIARRVGPAIHAEFFVTRDVPIDQLNVTGGTLKIVPLSELDEIESALTPSARFALQSFFGRELKSQT